MGPSGRNAWATRENLFEFFSIRPLSYEAGVNPVQGIRESLTPFNLAGVGSSELGDKPDRD